jgi:hypothetical protein
VNEIEAEAVASTPPVRDEKEVLRQSIERREAELREAVEELTAAVKNEVTLGAQIVDHPAAWLAGGFVVGMLLAWRR